MTANSSEIGVTQIRILAIDGGGIRGIIPAVILAALEQRTGKPIAEMFDVIAGTSTGALLATMLTVPDAGGKPKYSAAEMVDIYVNEGPVIFHKSFLRNIGDLGGATGPKYPDSGIESVLKKYLGDARLKDTLKEILVCSYEIQQRAPWFFRTSRAKASPLQNDFPLWEVARCSSAAPTYFSPERITSGDGKTWALVDGGVFANDPGMCALADVRAADPEADVLLVSLGTGEHTRPIQYQEAKGWGMLQWAKPILDVVFDGIGKATNYQLRQMLPDVRGDGRYFRFQAALSVASDELDDTDSENLMDLKAQAMGVITDEAAEFASLVGLLKRG